MRLRKIGEYQCKGDVGFYAEAVDIPREERRYIAVDWAMVPDELFRALDRKESVELEIDHDDLCLRIDDTLAD